MKFASKITAIKGPRLSPWPRLRSGKLYKKKLEEVSLWHVYIYIYPKVTYWCFFGQFDIAFCIEAARRSIKFLIVVGELWGTKIHRLHATRHSWFKATTALAVVGPISTIDGLMGSLGAISFNKAGEPAKGEPRSLRWSNSCDFRTSKQKWHPSTQPTIFFRF